jgi:DNA-binding PadR family transcriptional regulator
MRKNKTRYAILGLLSQCDMSGYDIKKAIEKSLGNFWNESYGQIYPVMKDLSDDGLVVKSVERNEGKPDRHVYSITDNGKKELREWLMEPPEPYKVRMEILLKLFFGTELPVEENIKHLERAKEEHLNLLDKYKSIGKMLNSEYINQAGHIYWLSTLKCGFRTVQAFIDWCDETIEELNKRRNNL